MVPLTEIREADEGQVYGKDDEANLLFNILTDQFISVFLLYAFLSKSLDRGETGVHPIGMDGH